MADRIAEGRQGYYDDLLEAYSALWHRHAALVARLRDHVYREDVAPPLPTPSELRAKA